MSAEFNTDLIVKQNYFSEQTSGIIVEVGAAGPDVLSFSKMFRDQGWRCISIELSRKWNFIADFRFRMIYPSIFNVGMYGSS